MKCFWRALALLTAGLIVSYCGAAGFATSPPVHQRYGDVAGEGSEYNQITTTDARLILQFCVDKLEGWELGYVADVDGDKEITTTDARLVLQAATGCRNYSCVGDWVGWEFTADENGIVIDARRKSPKLSWCSGVRNSLPHY